MGQQRWPQPHGPHGTTLRTRKHGGVSTQAGGRMERRGCGTSSLFALSFSTNYGRRSRGRVGEKRTESSLILRLYFGGLIIHNE